MNTRIIHAAIDEMDRVMKRGYARDEVPGEALLRSAPKPRSNDRRRARDEEEEGYRWTAGAAFESVKDMAGWLDPDERARFMEMLQSADLGEDEPPLSERPTPRPGGELEATDRRRMAGDRMAFDTRFPAAAAVEVEPVARPTRTGARSMSSAESASFAARFPDAAKVGFSR
jgi:hypothetical protein